MNQGQPRLKAAVAGRLNSSLSQVPALRSFVRTCVQAANTPIAKARLTRELAEAPRPLRLEIGGTAPRDGWVVTNVSAVTKHYLDATKRWPLEDDSVEYVYNDNVIEHLTLAAGRAMLLEAHRCLRPGGVIRIVTPDLRAHVDMYLSGAPALSNSASSHYKKLGLEVAHPVDLVRIPVAAFGHHAGYLYDFETLAAELLSAGFSNPVKCEAGKSEHAALVGLDLRSHEGGAQLAVEATA
jgi:SAM-dependent methyltransferase